MRIIPTWWAYILSYTKVQQTPPAYRGRQTLQSTAPATADQPRSAPQLNARPIESKTLLYKSSNSQIKYKPRTACGQSVYLFIRGYMVTSDSEEAPSNILVRIGEKFSTQKKVSYLYQFNCRRTPNPTVSCPARKPSACFWVISPRASGLSFVRAKRKKKAASQTHCNNTKDHKQNNVPTDLSRFLSHISLIVQPAPRITSAPMPNMLMHVKGTVYGSWSA